MTATTHTTPLRVGDISGLHLDDIDWDRAVIRVSGKSRREAELPLPQDVGDALRDYILEVRPRSDERKVFSPQPGTGPALVERQHQKLHRQPCD